MSERPRLLDLFCKAGGASMGLYRAGFDVTGCDIEPQPHYPFSFILADALHVPLDGYDAFWASPPCQAYTKAGRQWRRAGKVYPDIIAPMRERLRATGKPFIIENAPGAPLQSPMMLNGAMFGLRVKRDRLFECSFPVPFTMLPCQAAPMKMGRPFDARREGAFWPVGHFSGVAEARTAMGCDWMTRAELTQAIPPAYTEWLGRHLLLECQR